MVQWPDHPVDGEVIVVDLGDQLKLQFGATLYNPAEQKHVRVPSCTITMSPNGLRHLVDAIQKTLGARAQAQAEADSGQGEPAPADEPIASEPDAPRTPTLVRPSAAALAGGDDVL